MDQSMYNLNEVYNNNSAENLLDKSFRRKVFFTVTIAHVIFVIGPFVWLGLWTKFYDKTPPPMQVSLVNLVPAGKITDDLPGAPNKPKEDKKESKKEDKKEAPVEDESNAPEPPVKVDKKVPVEKAIEKPVEKPVEKETVKVPTEKPTPVVKTTEKPADTSRLKKPTEIVKSTTVVKGKNPTPAAPKISGSDLASKLKKIQNQCKITDTGNGGGSGAGGPGDPGGIGVPNGVVGAVPAGYYETVSVYLYSLWKEPGKPELKGLKPTVTLHISIDASGNIKSAKIIKKSNNLPMDSSVEELLSKLKKLPPPPQGALELDISLEIDDNQ